VLICSERKVLLADFWWLVCSERKILLAGGWFVLREKYCWLVADKPNEHAERFDPNTSGSPRWPAPGPSQGCGAPFEGGSTKAETVLSETS
jgi:hypothetical protein